MNRFVFVAVALILVAGTVVRGRSAPQPSPRPPGNNYYPPQQGNNYNQRPYVSVMQHHDSELGACGQEQLQLDTCKRQRVLLITHLRRLQNEFRPSASGEAKSLASEEADTASRLEQTNKEQLVAKVEKLLEKLLLETA